MENLKDEILRELFNNKLIPKTLYGIYGKAGSGKTTLCIHIIKELLPHKDVIYIDTESGFYIERAEQIIKDKNLLDKLYIKKADTLPDLKKTLEGIDDLITNKNLDIGAIFIDSLSSVYRLEIKDKENINIINRLMSEIVINLRRLADKYNIPVIATHQVYIDFDTGKEEIVGRDLVKYDFKIMVRIKKDDAKRTLELIRHPFLPYKKINAVIENEGFKKKNFKLF